jgi:hypothetical protein
MTWWNVINAYFWSGLIMWVHASELWELAVILVFTWLTVTAILWPAPHLLYGLIGIWVFTTVILWVSDQQSAN